jgi:DNA-binding transcriptional LysR family regulator
MSRDDCYNPIDMKSLLCFATMARLGSLTQASIELGISDAAVSQRIKSVEKHLGKKLYESRGGKIRLTEEGERTKAFAMRVFDELSEFEGDIREEAFRGAITVGGASHIFRYQFSEIVHAFRKQHSHAQLRLLDRQIFETIDLVRRNEIDIGLIPSAQLMPADLVFHPWRIFKAYVLVPRGHPLAHNKLPTLETLMNEETLLQYPQVVASSTDTQERGSSKPWSVSDCRSTWLLKLAVSKP